MKARSRKKMERLINTLQKALREMEGDAEVYEAVENWRGNGKLRENIGEFVDWHYRRLAAMEDAP